MFLNDPVMVLIGARAPRREGAGGVRLLAVPGRVFCMDESQFLYG